MGDGEAVDRVDISHVGPKMTKSAIAFAEEEKSPCCSHVLPTGLKGQRRNKIYEIIRLLGTRDRFMVRSQS